MTVDKILVIVVLVLSVVFVVAAINGYAKDRDMRTTKDNSIQDWKTQAEAGVVALKAEQEVNKDLQSQVAKHIAETATLTEQLKTAKGETDTANTQAKEQKTANENLVKQLTDVRGDLAGLKTDIKTLTDSLGSTKVENSGLREKVAALETERNAAVDGLAKANKELETLKKDTIPALQKKLDDLIRTGGVSTGMTTAGLQLDCAITDVRRGDGYALVSLDKGKKDGLDLNVKLFVWNSAEGYKGKVTIVEIHDNTAVARVDYEEPKIEIRKGDTASVLNL
jgi:septal ring factor EnvC (AmiA/AmiB activator)